MYYVSFLGALFLLLVPLAKLQPNVVCDSVFTKKLSSQADVETLLKKAASEETSSNTEIALKLYERALVLLTKSGDQKKISFVLKKMGVQHYKLNRLQRAQKYFRESISKDSFSVEAADSHFNLALIQRRLKQKDSLFYFLERSLRIYKMENATKKKFGTYLKAGILYKNSGNYADAITYLIWAYEGFQKLNDPQKKATVCSIIGATQRLMKNHVAALRYYKESLRLRSALRDSPAMANSYNSLGLVYKENNQNDSAISYFSKAMVLKKRLDKPRELGRTLSNLASVYATVGDFDKAFRTYEDAIKLKRLEKDTLALLTTFNELAFVTIKKQDYASAKRYLDLIKRYKNEIDNNVVVLRSLEVRALYFQNIGAYEKALNLQQMHSKLYQKIFHEKQSEQVQELQERYESKKKEHEISELKVTDAMNSLIIADQKKALYKRDTLLAIAVVLILTFLGAYLFLKQQQRIKKKVFEYEKLKAVLQGQELLKEQISKDLHDIVAVNYEGIRLKVNALGAAKNRDELIENITTEIREVNQQVRLISHRLSPLGNRLENEKLSELIVSQLSEMQYYNRVIFNLELPFPDVVDQMCVESQTNFYAVLLEVVQNSIKHGKAKKIQITHNIEEKDILKFSVIDDGIGFEKNNQKGIGLYNINQRMALLQGEIIVSSSANGTVVEILFPIKTNLV